MSSGNPTDPSTTSTSNPVQNISPQITNSQNGSEGQSTPVRTQPNLNANMSQQPSQANNPLARSNQQLAPQNMNNSSLGQGGSSTPSMTSPHQQNLSINPQLSLAQQVLAQNAKGIQSGPPIQPRTIQQQPNLSQKSQLGQPTSQYLAQQAFAAAQNKNKRGPKPKPKAPVNLPARNMSALNGQQAALLQAASATAAQKQQFSQLSQNKTSQSLTGAAMRPNTLPNTRTVPATGGTSSRTALSPLLRSVSNPATQQQQATLQAQAIVEKLRQNNLIIRQALQRADLTPEEREKYEKDQANNTRYITLFESLSPRTTAATINTEGKVMIE
ncbi:hypothetical protein K493DRAFT_372937 [Basidiobolus meristosporus CBS 931.73]|uniref:Uncharacterized protein n=1 Tax=Basidiobolus meristosporus CBS 931.73 TaxID=1314790 RepID=A0A1Y1Z7M4_9FUNG|nr:hypothetical protein K493DRAFT_372937 [Basidiobolus meristosporus CBS 931.73]|eukprot:ORY06114.1 hypothetical protein K493DRAFT_372937 [Basidiobolus meristosporus CBS 931.73]